MIPCSDLEKILIFHPQQKSAGVPGLQNRITRVGIEQWQGEIRVLSSKLVFVVALFNCPKAKEVSNCMWDCS
jgi:hypothetical protein